MLAIQTNIFSVVLLIIIALCLYLNGYKKLGLFIRNGVFGFCVFYTFLVLVIGLWG